MTTFLLTTGIIMLARSRPAIYGQRCALKVTSEQYDVMSALGVETKSEPHVRYWHLADIDVDAEHVRFLV